MALPPWVAEALRLPLAFAQVREDADLDAAVVRLRGRDVRVILIASGGCTAALLATCPEVAHLHLVDANPAQIALTRFKLHLLAQREPRERLERLGPSAIAESLGEIGLPADALGPPDVVAALGPDQAGRYERVFAALRRRLPVDIADLLHLRDPVEQARRVAPDTSLGRALDDAFDDAMALPHLVALFGEGATRNPVEPFARHFARRTRHALATLPAADNPYLWKVLREPTPDDPPVPWLTRPIPARLPSLTLETAFMVDALRRASPEYDVVHLSNILDWLAPDEAEATLAAARAVLRPNGLVFIRQLNSTLPIRALDSGFDWLPEGDALHARDRSYFYRALHLGRRP